MNISTFIEFEKVYIEWDFDDRDDSIEILGVWLEKPGKDELDITDYLTEYELEQARQRVIEIVEKAASRVEAWEEERPRIVAPGAALKACERALKAEGVEGV